MLGTAFRGLLPDSLAAGRDCLDVTRPGNIHELVAGARAEIVINCAAHTDVDGAERDPDAAFAANAVLPGIVATACRRSGATLLHLSSTGCYGNWKSTAFTDEDEPQPTTAHHRSKVSGERAVRESGCEHLILRAGWLFGGSAAQKKNFVWHRLLEARSRDVLTSDPHQHGNPTLVDDLAAQALHLVGQPVRGTFNCVSGPGVSRFEYVREIVRVSGLPCTVERSTAPFRRTAPVSQNEMAVNYRLGLLGLDAMPSWKTSLARYVAELINSPSWTAYEGGQRPS